MTTLPVLQAAEAFLAQQLELDQGEINPEFWWARERLRVAVASERERSRKLRAATSNLEGAPIPPDVYLDAATIV